MLKECIKADELEVVDKIIEAYDVKDVVKDIPVSKPAEFWNAVVLNSNDFKKLMVDANKKTDPMLKTRQAMYEAKLAADMARTQYRFYDAKSITDTLIAHAGFGPLYPDLTLEIIDEPYANAFTCPESRIYFTGELLESMDYSYGMLLGTLVHEATHFFLQHIFAAEYATQKKQQGNQIAAAVTSGVNVLANAYAQANGAVDASSWDSVNKMTQDLAQAAVDDAQNRYRPKYNRNQEYEADIVAYRFLEWMGLGGEFYIKALETIGTDDDKYYSSESDHPKTSDRIALLKYISENYPMY